MKVERGTSDEWLSANPVLGAGVAGLETDTQKYKIGDGLTKWADLKYVHTSTIPRAPSGRQRDILDIRLTDPNLSRMSVWKYGGPQGNNGYYAPTRFCKIDGKRVLISQYSNPRELDKTGAPIGVQLASTYAGMDGTNPYMQYVWGADESDTQVGMVSYNRHFVKLYDRTAWLSGTASTPAATIGVYGQAGHVSEKKLYNPRDIKALPNGNWLIANYNGNNDAGGQSNNQGYVGEWTSQGEFVAVRVAPQGTEEAGPGELAIIPKANCPSRLEFDPDHDNILYIQNHTFGITAVDINDWSVKAHYETVSGAPFWLTAKGIGFRKIAKSQGGGFLVSSVAPDRTIFRTNDAFEYLWHVSGYDPSNYNAKSSSDPYSYYNVYDVDLLEDGSVLVLDTSQYTVKRFLPPDFIGSGVGNGQKDVAYLSLQMDRTSPQGRVLTGDEMRKWSCLNNQEKIFDWDQGIVHVPTGQVFADILSQNNRFALHLEC